MDMDRQLQLELEQQQKKRVQAQQREENPDEDTMMYAQRPEFVALDAQESIFDRGSINQQQGINTQPSIFQSSWK